MFGIETTTKSIDCRNRLNLNSFIENLNLSDKKVRVQSTDGLIVIENFDQDARLLDVLHTMCQLNRVVEDNDIFCEYTRYALTRLENIIEEH